MDKTQAPAPKKSPSRAERLAIELRANLKRRKQQEAARQNTTSAAAPQNQDLPTPPQK